MVDVDDDDKSGVRVWGELVRPVTAAARTERDSMLFSLDNQCRGGKSEWGEMVVMMRTRGEMVDEHATRVFVSRRPAFESIVHSLLKPDQHLPTRDPANVPFTPSLARSVSVRARVTRKEIKEIRG